MEKQRTNSTKRILPAVAIKSNEEPNPYLVLKNIFQETEQSKKKKQRKQERNASSKASKQNETQSNTKLDCLASAASILLTPNAKSQEKEPLKPYISPVLDTTTVNSPRRSKTIRQIIEIDKEETNNQSEIVDEREGNSTPIKAADVNSSENLTKIASCKKRNSKSKLQKSDYFEDFFENIKDLEKKE